MSHTEELDKWFSLFIRLSRADYRGYVLCYTCSARLPFQEMDCGHFNSRGILITRFEEDNCRPQCRDCNRLREGKMKVFEDELREELGDERVDELIAMRPRQAHYDTEWYVGKVIHYKKLVNNLISAI